VGPLQRFTDRVLSDESEPAEFDYEPHSLDYVPADLYDSAFDVGETPVEEPAA
jgi:hypothetical protein